jgi:hypothetical protein
MLSSSPKLTNRLPLPLLTRSVGRLIATANHLNRKFTIGVQAILKGQAGRFARQSPRVWASGHLVF